ncbi:Filament-like plant protein 4 [Striga hermonthica]|uniref:Filament-like plant protein 4 n=1 Tax=Striga hermonthica TaxID=68872 RepID=A0A9N7NVE0_STRHE|nr:Filament-like plant protein 4 [Striga hermonthica]
MDKRGWPWKRKSSDKLAIERTIFSASSSPATTPVVGGNQADKGKHDVNNKKPKHVKISIESYMYLTGLDDQVKSYEEQVQTMEDEMKKMNEKLSEAHSEMIDKDNMVKTLEDEVKKMNEKLSEARMEMTDKDNLVKQHAKVAEEAISGWEKVESEAAMLKTQVESVTLLKQTAEDRALHLDGALKECMKQIRNLKEEHNQKLHELILDRTNIFDKMKRELESQISNFEQDLLNTASENAALSRSLQERSNVLLKISEEKSRADAEIVVLKGRIELLEKEVNSLKYELHISRKELEIRNEEKNISVRSLEVANKQYLEGVKKIAKLEAECQRLRGLVRKKLPGPAAVAQMKFEVENSRRDYNNEPRLRRSPRSPLKPTTTQFSQMPEFSLDTSIKYQKENELLTSRLMAMDEERRVLKEALENCNSSLQASRTMHTETVKLQRLEACGQANAQVSTEDFSIKDEYEDSVSCAGSWTTVSISGNSYIQKEKTTRSPCTPENISSHLELMDDFLEMEKLADMSNESNGTVFGSEVSVNKGNTGSDANDQGLQIAISCLYDFVRILGKEAKAVLKTSDDDDELIRLFDAFTTKYSESINSKINLADFVRDMSGILNKASSMQLNFLGFKSSDVGNFDTSDCIDKVALPENKAIVEPSGERYSNNCSKFLDSTSVPDILSEGNNVPTYESKGNLGRCSLEEFEQLNVAKDRLDADLARCREDFESTNSRLLETEKLLTDVKSELTLAQKSNSLTETQLKCMAESYKVLETRAEELQNEVNYLNGKLENLDNELQEERRSHQKAVTRCNELLEQLQRIDVCKAEAAVKTSQEKELASAAEKLVECQETIFLLDKQLRALRSQKNVSSQQVEVSSEDKNYYGPSEMEMSNSFSSLRTSMTECTLDHLLNGPPSPSESLSNGSITSNIGSKLPKSRTTRSGSSSASSTPTPEKHTRGISRFFSSKGKSAHLLV